MKRIIMQPCADKVAVRNYHKTIEGSIPLEDIKEYILPKVYAELKSIYPDGFIKVWGATPSQNPSKKNSKENIWAAINPGDIALMAKKGKYFARAVVTYTLNNSELANYLWGTTENGDTWEYIYFVDQVSPIDIAYIDFNRAVGYADNKVPQGFGMLSEEKCLAFLEAFSYINNPSPLSNNNDIDDLTRYDKDGSLDIEVLRKIRAEQADLRRRMFKANKAKCCICGKKYSKDMMVAAHIKKRADCSDKEKRDLDNIAAPMCRFGCDELYERGYIGVSDTGKVTILDKPTTPKNSITEAMTSYLSSIENMVCSSWNNKTRGYFAYHYHKHTSKDNSRTA